MKTFHLFLASAALLGSTQPVSGLGIEHFGSVEEIRATVQQPGWPTGMVEIVGHKSRVYSMWINGSENFHFNATTEEMGELIHLYSEAHLREHILTIKHGKGTARTFDKDTIDCNVSYYFLGGITRFSARRRKVALTYEPTLTIYIDANADEEWWGKMTIPANIIVNSEVADWPVKNAVTRPKRKLWHAKVMFDETHPAADFENGVFTKVTLWEKDEEAGFYLGKIGHKGQFSVAFSENENCGP